MEVARHVQTSQNRNLVIFLLYLNCFLFYCDAKRSDILRKSNHVFILLITFCWYEQVKDFVK